MVFIPPLRRVKGRKAGTGLGKKGIRQLHVNLTVSKRNLKNLLTAKEYQQGCLNLRRQWAEVEMRRERHGWHYSSGQWRWTDRPCRREACLSKRPAQHHRHFISKWWLLFLSVVLPRLFISTGCGCFWDLSLMVWLPGWLLLLGVVGGSDDAEQHQTYWYCSCFAVRWFYSD